MDNIDPNLQLTLVQAQQNLRDFDYQKNIDRQPLQQAVADAQYAIANAVSALQIPALQTKVNNLKTNPQQVQI